MGKKNNKNEPPSLFDNLDLFSMAGSQKAVQPESFEETAAPAKDEAKVEAAAADGKKKTAPAGEGHPPPPAGSPTFCCATERSMCTPSTWATANWIGNCAMIPG